MRLRNIRKDKDAKVTKNVAILAVCLIAVLLVAGVAVAYYMTAETRGPDVNPANVFGRIDYYVDFVGTEYLGGSFAFRFQSVRDPNLIPCSYTAQMMSLADWLGGGEKQGLFDVSKHFTVVTTITNQVYGYSYQTSAGFDLAWGGSGDAYFHLTPERPVYVDHRGTYSILFEGYEGYPSLSGSSWTLRCQSTLTINV